MTTYNIGFIGTTNDVRVLVDTIRFYGWPVTGYARRTVREFLRSLAVRDHVWLEINIADSAEHESVQRVLQSVADRQGVRLIWTVRA